MLKPNELKPHTVYLCDHPDYGLVALTTKETSGGDPMLFAMDVQAGLASDLQVVRELDLAGLAMQAGHFVRGLAGLAAREAGA